MSIASSSSSQVSSEKSMPVSQKRLLKRKLGNSTSDNSSGSSDEESSDDDEVLQKNPKDRAVSKIANESEKMGEEEEEEEQEEVKVLSHKEQRRLKKKQKLMENAEATDSEEGASKGLTKSKSVAKDKVNANGKDKDRAALPKRQNSIWVGNLSFKTTPDSLRAFFDGVGEITRVHMPMKNDAGEGGKSVKRVNRGFAYVDFGTPDSKAIAVTMSEKNLDGRKLLIKDGKDFEGRPVPSTTPGAGPGVNGGATVGISSGLSKTAQKILSSQKQPAGPCLFLGNLGFEATEQGIRGMIEGHAKALLQIQEARAKAKDGKRKGEDTDLSVVKDDEDGAKTKEGGKVGIDVGIKKVRMGTFEDSGLCKGFAFVDFTSVAHATATLTNSRNHFLDGRKLVVEYASPDAARRGGHREKGTGGGDSHGKKFDGKFARRNDSESGERGMRRKKQQDTGDNEISNENAEEGDKNDAAALPPHTRDKRPRQDDRSTKSYKRTKPGAALALAQREKYAIVPSEGTRLTFS
ncbi:hypothetical protein M0805_006086 [Coniferiporia weirii]|nr:hypothetical protein M0805_006086 [Coniferiporia weirii]